LIAFGQLLLPLVGAVFASLGLYLLALAAAAGIGRRIDPAAEPDQLSRLAVLVPAHDEERLVGACISSLRAQSYPSELYRIVVIADNCSDRTADVAKAAGAEVMVRTSTPEGRGKGQALRWAMDALLSAVARPDAVVVVDADSVCDPGMLAALQRELARGHEVVQADYALAVDAGSPRSELVAAAFLLFHRVRFTGRARLGMAANLVGNGMLFGRRVLERHPWSAFTGVEDLEFSIQLRLAGIEPRFAPSARIVGPGPASRGGAVRQRMRWEGGRFHAVKTYLWPLVRTAAGRRDARLLDAALDLATPPLSLLGMALAAGLAITGAAVLLGIEPAWALLPWLIGLASVAGFVVTGLWVVRVPGSTWRALLKAPAFLAWKLITYARLARGFDAAAWDRTDRAGEPGPPAGAQRVDVVGVPIDTVDMAGAISRLRDVMTGGRLFQVSTINLDFMVRAQSDPEVRRIFQHSDLNLADGAPVVWLGRLLGAAVPERVAGADLVPALMAEAAKLGARVFFLGGEGGVAEIAARKMEQLNPGLVVAGTYEPARASVENLDSAEILSRIREARADILLVAFGHPKQERWIDLHRTELPVSVAIGVGCVFDLIAGRSRRAPAWMQAAGLEWAYRLAGDPKRLFGRYATDAAWLLPITARALRSRFSSQRVAEAA
jgi:exopolysaccharide biosynthesis WecB/TagA/CpsF family protein